jgi:threonine aldolase
MLSDFRSDTLTKPTPAMMEAMFSAPVGDDVFGEDPTVNELEAKAAAMFGKEAALFCPSGTMANQIAIKGHSNAPGELICDKLSHVYLYEVGGIAFHSGLSVSLCEAERGILKPTDIIDRINLFSDMHKAPSQLVVLENTCNKGGGSCYELQNLQDIKKLCFEKDLKLHLDGARVFNAIVAKGYSSREIGDCFDSISICLSKGLGTPMGSLLIGNKDYIQKCRRIRKLFGGGMRQAGFMAAAGIYALDHHIARLADDNGLAKTFGNEIKKLPYIETVFPVETNIVIAQLDKKLNQTEFILKLATDGVKAVPFGPQLVRFVTHLDVNASNVSHALDVLKKIAD